MILNVFVRFIKFEIGTKCVILNKSMMFAKSVMLIKSL